MGEVKDGTEFLDKIIPKSERNGAAMRAYPLGILPDLEEVKKKTTIQAGVTHQTDRAIRSAEAVALITHYFIYELGPKESLISFLFDQQAYAWQGNWTGPVEIDGVQTVEALLTVLLNGSDLTGMLHQSVQFGGDVDTVASLALAIGSLVKSIDQNLPERLYVDLENGQYGRDYLMDLDEKILNLY